MNPADYDFLTQYLHTCSGLALGSGKEYLLEARLIPLAQSWGISDLAELICALRKNQDERLGKAVIESMTTNETSFFRDKHPFEEMRNTLLPAIIHSRQIPRHFRIWSAASSTGQEAYSLAMMLHEFFPDVVKNWRIDIVGTDISQNALALAKEGIYSQFEVQRGLPIQYLMKYFAQVERGWQIKQEIRSMVSFKPLNLLETFQYLGPFDVIFCRNVLIYFNATNKKLILDRIAKCLRPDGYLILGAAETVLGITETLRRETGFRSVIYIPNTAAPACA
ncbi:MAG: protein-glutamate O-methyltransferase CheR [Planctomycetaceae bacterium]